MNNWILVGHRGVGKTHLMDRWRAQSNFSHISFLSLDQEIEKQTGRSIDSLFQEEGEEKFRQYEKQIFKKLVDHASRSTTFIDVGAGFLGDKPPGWKALWVQRPTNPSQYQFLNRPNLDKGLKISQSRFNERDNRYAKLADFSVEFIEGNFHDPNFEICLLQSLLENKKIDLNSGQWFLTLLNKGHCKFHLQNPFYRNLNFELRDDLLSLDAIENFLRIYPKSLVSLRDKTVQASRLLQKHSFWDWPLEWGHNSEAPIVSLHQRKESLAETLKTFPESEQILKLAIQINSFAELKEGFYWQQENPTQRAFLPRSANGRWSWFRLLMGHQAPLNFLREAHGSSPDQPSLNQVALFEPRFKKFAAILGDPVNHSFTPSFHHQFFKSHQANVLAISVTENEFKTAIDFLIETGLCWGAVTSPLKNKAQEWLGASTALNTICLNKKAWQGINTDHYGFSQLIKDLSQGEVAVWGGGGTLVSMASQLKTPGFYSSRTGKLKSGTPCKNPQIIIWAVGGKSFSEEGVFPSLDWQPEQIIDLNYTLDSPGVECAHNYGCQYRSGLAMFTAQAYKQQEFWNECQLK